MRYLIETIKTNHMKHLRLLISTVVLLFYSMTNGQFEAWAQKAAPGEISGVVKDLTSKETLPYASVVIKGTVTGMITDLDGIPSRFHIPGTVNRKFL
jgi:hypothetical protein